MAKNIIVETREVLGLTQMELANLIKKHVSTISHWEGQPEITDRVVVLAMDRLRQTDRPLPWDD
jgi:ribosome-binding protein aMBF1 (putative translation factor)